MIKRWLFACCMLIFSVMAMSQNAPVTSAPSIYGATPGEEVTVPVTVSGFNQIGAISLNLVYDPDVLNFVQGEINNALNGMFAIGSNSLPDGMNSLAIGWFGDAASLPDGAVLINLKFNFNGGSTVLEWYDDGASCEYTDANYNALNDIPADCHFINGMVTSDKCLNLTVLLEGLYDPALHRMRSALNVAPAPCTDGVADYIQAELRYASDYSTVAMVSSNLFLSATGQAQLLVPQQNNGFYYIAIRHRNSVTTVSAEPVSFLENVINYSFTDQASKAFGSNMKLSEDGKWAFFAGDVNQDGSVDTGDMSPVDNDAAGFASGYLSTDVNGDGMVDTADVTLIDNNAATFTGSITP